MKIMQRLRSPLLVQRQTKEWSLFSTEKQNLRKYVALNIHRVFAYAIGDRCSVSRYLLTGERMLSHVNGRALSPEMQIYLDCFCLFKRPGRWHFVIIAILPIMDIGLSIIREYIFKALGSKPKYYIRSSIFLFCYFSELNFYII